MSERTNRRDLIIDVAGQLFIKQGYTATSVRQIADEVGVTEAALYYHFKDGKRELLQAVLECHLPDFEDIYEHCHHAETLKEALECMGMHIYNIKKNIHRMRWIMSEFPLFTDEERALVHAKHIKLHAGLVRLISQYVSDVEQAQKIAWFVQCAGFGYGQLFYNLNLAEVADFQPTDLVKVLSSIIGDYE